MVDIRVTLRDLKPHITTYKTMDAVNQKSQIQVKIQTICDSDFHVLVDLRWLSGEAEHTEATAQPHFPHNPRQVEPTNQKV